MRLAKGQNPSNQQRDDPGFLGETAIAMKSDKSILRESVTTFVVIVIGLILTSCQTGQFNLSGQNPVNSSTPVAKRLTPASGEVIGNGAIRIAMLLPLTAPGNAGKVGNQLANAAKLAMRDFGQNTLQLVIKNTAGQAANSQQMASEAMREGASAILGPLFSGSVSAASAVTLPANTPIIAFSSDPRRARRGVYLMSFSPKADIARMLNYAISRGNSRFVVMLPNGAYGTLAETTIKEVLGKSSAQVVSLAKYDHTGESIEASARSIVVASAGATAVYVPDGGQVPLAVLMALKRAGVKTQSKMVLGSGQWETTPLGDPILTGAYFPGRDKRKFANFSSNYKAAYGEHPSSMAGLAYDAVSMAADLVRSYGRDAFKHKNIESRNGYSGVNGIFRFRPDGNSERGLAIYQVQAGRAEIVSQAPSTFGSGS